MKTNQILESKIREANYASLDAFRSALRSHPLVADYVCDLLIARGVVTLQEDGSVIGIPASASAIRSGRATTTVDPTKKGEWKAHWPDKGELIEVISQEDEDGNSGILFGSLQEYLQAQGEPHSHWILLHSLWNLLAAGLVEKKGKKYVMTPAGAAKHPSNDHAFTMALKKAGPPYAVDAVARALREIPGHNFYGKHSAYKENPLTQKEVDLGVKYRKQSGAL